MTTLKNINHILHKQFNNLPSASIWNGQIGASVISAFVDDDDMPTHYQAALNRLLNFRQGIISTEIWKVWCISLLNKYKLIRLPDSYTFAHVLHDAISLSRQFCFQSPIKLTRNLRLYPFGLFGLMALPNLEGLPFYSMAEQIVLYMRDCEYFFTHNIPYIHNPNYLSASILHSTLRFMQLSEDQKIFPWKAQEIQNIIATMEYDNLGSAAVDRYILNFMLRQPLNGDNLNSPQNLSYLGTIAFLYNMPELFSSKSQNIILADIEPDNLVGIGLGLLSSRLKDMYTL